MALAISKENMNQNAEKAGQWFDRVRSLQITRKLTMMAMIALAVAAGLAVFFWSQKPGYQSLYTGLDERAMPKRPTCCAPRRSPTRSIRVPAPFRCRRTVCTTPA